MEKEPPRVKQDLTPEFLRQGAYHVASQFGTEVPLFKDLMAAANALEEGDAEKAGRIIRANLYPAPKR